MQIIVVGGDLEMLRQKFRQLVGNLLVHVLVQSSQTHQVRLRTRDIIATPQHRLIRNHADGNVSTVNGRDINDSPGFLNCFASIAETSLRKAIWTVFSTSTFVTIRKQGMTRIRMTVRRGWGVWVESGCEVMESVFPS